MAAVTSVLIWRSGGSLQDFVAEISEREHFVIQFNDEQPQGYKWQLIIVHDVHRQSVFLHGHTDLQEAKHAALVHLGEA